MKDFNGYVEDSRDALIIIEAAKLGHLRLTKNRLTHYERNLICPGACFVWEQKGSNIQRWTDGKSWSSSRYSKGFFSYIEKPKRNHYNKSNSYDLIKRTFTIDDYNGMKFQLINYIYKDPEKNESLVRPSNCDFNYIFLENNSTIFSRKPSLLNLSSNNDLTMDPTSLITPIPPIINNELSPLTYFGQNSSPASLSPIENFKPLETLECCTLKGLPFSEDIRQLSLLKLNL